MVVLILVAVGAIKPATILAEELVKIIAKEVQVDFKTKSELTRR